MIHVATYLSSILINRNTCTIRFRDRSSGGEHTPRLTKLNADEDACRHDTASGTGGKLVKLMEMPWREEMAAAATMLVTLVPPTFAY